MNASSIASARTVLNNCLVGANPIIWSNDDFYELAGDVLLDVILREMKEAGFAGTELGHAYPRSPAPLAKALAAHQLRLVSGWHSTHLATHDYAQEEAAFVKHLSLLKPLGSNVVIVAECSHAIHGIRTASLGYGHDDRRTLNAAGWTKMTKGLTRMARICADEGLKLVYHHHMGTVVQTEEELDRLMESTPGLYLVLDAGHLTFAGIDPLRVLAKHLSRVAHVHLKSTRPEVVARSRRERWSFCRAVIEGVFTIPGSGAVDYPTIFRLLKLADYQGWLVVEAEEDPNKVPALPKAKRARDYVRQFAGV